MLFRSYSFCKRFNNKNGRNLCCAVISPVNSFGIKVENGELVILRTQQFFFLNWLTASINFSVSPLSDNAITAVFFQWNVSIG